MRQKLLRILREPLFHFVLIGAALFAAYGIVGADRRAGDGARIVVSAAEVERLASYWEKRRLRPPTPQEMETLLAEFVREEVLYREALALGLDRDDAVIRRRLRQKLEFLAEDLAVAGDPDEAALRAWHAEHADRYRAPARFGFTQVLLDPDRRGPGIEEAARLMLVGLREDRADPREIGDGRMLAPVWRDSAGPEVTAMFGERFAEALSSLEPGIWSGPIRSGYGLHLVRLDARSEGRRLPFEEVRRDVENDWAHERRREANAAFYRDLRKRYEVAVERPEGRASGADDSGISR